MLHLLEITEANGSESFHHVGRREGGLIEVLNSQNRYNPVTGGPLHIPGPGSPARQEGFTGTYWQQRPQDLQKR